MKVLTQIVLYTDLDGTFLDQRSNSFADALPGLGLASLRGIPIVFCSSKTRAEIEALHHMVGLRAPFIVENGGAIYIPEGYFSFPLEGALTRDHYCVIELGTPYAALVAALRSIASNSDSIEVVGFHDLSVEEVAARCGLSRAEARRAK